MPAWEAAGRALVVRVRVTPRGGRDALDGVATLADGSEVLKLRVRAAPEDGAANEAARRTLAKAVGVAPGAVALVAGHSGRLKTLRIEGDPGTLAPALARAAGVVPA